MKELKKIAEKEDYFEGAKEEYKALKEKLMHTEIDDLEKFKVEIKKRLKSEIITRYYFQKGRIEGGLTSDEYVQKALEVLRDKATYNAILTSSTTSEVEPEEKK